MRLAGTVCLRGERSARDPAQLSQPGPALAQTCSPAVSGTLTLLCSQEPSRRGAGTVDPERGNAMGGGQILGQRGMVMLGEPLTETARPGRAS